MKLPRISTKRVRNPALQAVVMATCAFVFAVFAIAACGSSTSTDDTGYSNEQQSDTDKTDGAYWGAHKVNVDGTTCVIYSGTIICDWDHPYDASPSPTETP